MEFSSFEELQDHIHRGQHSKATSESLYDGIRRGWASKFSSLTLESRATSTVDEVTSEGRDECRNMGWALQRPRGGGTRFTDNVKAYLTMRFDDGEKTGRKADPTQVAADMRKARNIEGTRKFNRSEWLTKTQVQGIFSRLASMRRRKTTVGQAQEEEDDDDNSLIEDEISYLDETARWHAMEDILSQVGLIHPITYDGHDICEHARLDTLSRYNVTMFKAMCDHFFLTALLAITRIMNKINNREEMKYMCKVIRSDEVKRAGANGTRGPMRGTAHYIKKKRRYK